MKNISEKRKGRNSNVELLRIVTVLAVVAGHFVGQSGLKELSPSINDFILMLLCRGHRIGVNIFLLIGVWYMVDSRFKPRRILTMHGQVYLYCALMTSIMFVLDRDGIGIRDAVRGFMPLLGRTLWFASAYITLLAFKPFLDIILEWDRGALCGLVLFFLFFVSFVSTIPMSELEDSYVCDTLWFLIVYLFVGYYKMYPPILKFGNWINLAVGGGIYLALSTGAFIGGAFGTKSSLCQMIGTMSYQYIQDIKSLPNFLCALFIFAFFINSDEKNYKVINIVSSTTFSVYLIHQVPVFIPYLWGILFHANTWVPSHRVTYVIFVVFTVYMVCSIIDVVCRKIYSKLWPQSRLFHALESRLDTIYRKFGFSI